MVAPVETKREQIIQVAQRLKRRRLEEQGSCLMKARAKHQPIPVKVLLKQKSGKKQATKHGPIPVKVLPKQKSGKKQATTLPGI